MKLLKSFAFALITGAGILLNFASCAAMFQPKIDMNYDSNSVNLSDMLVVKKAKTSLDAPSQVFASQASYSSLIKVNWSKVEGAASYRLERAIIFPAEDGSFSEPAEEDFSVITLAGYDTATCWENSFIDIVDTSDGDYSKRYYYRVSAQNTLLSYEASEFSSSNMGYLFAPPTNAQAEGGMSEDSIKITWKKTDNATKYLIYKTTNSNGSASELIAEVPANLASYTDLITQDFQGVEFYYKVIAQNADGQNSIASNLAMGYTLVKGAPSRVQNVHITNGRGYSTNSIGVEWDASFGADGIKYSLYRVSSVDSTLILVKDGLDGVTSYIDSSSLKPGVYYYYQVQAWCVDDEGKKLKASFSDSLATSQNPAEGYVISCPSNITSDKTASKVLITFAPAIGSSEEQYSFTYNIYGSKREDFSDASLITTVSGSNDLNAQGLYEVAVALSGANYYKITTSNEAGVESVPSEIFAVSPFAATNLTVTKNDNPNKYTGEENKSGVFPVTISWSKPNDEGVAGYFVYRANSKDGGFRKVHDQVLTVDTLSFVDKNETAKAGSIYYYKVLTVNSLGQGKNYSNADWGYGSLTADQYMREYNKTIKNSQTKLTLMHKSGNTDKLGKETVNGTLTGTLSYDAGLSGLKGRVVMKYTDYADFIVHEDGSVNATAIVSGEVVIGNAGGKYFVANGNSNTTADTSANGSMDGTVENKGMYPGSVKYDSIQIKNGNAGGGVYLITRRGLDNSNYDASPIEVSYLVGNE